MPPSSDDLTSALPAQPTGAPADATVGEAALSEPVASPPAEDSAATAGPPREGAPHRRRRRRRRKPRIAAAEGSGDPATPAGPAAGEGLPEPSVSEIAAAGPAATEAPAAASAPAPSHPPGRRRRRHRKPRGTLAQSTTVETGSAPPVTEPTSGGAAVGEPAAEGTHSRLTLHLPQGSSEQKLEASAQPHPAMPAGRTRRRRRRKSTAAEGDLTARPERSGRTRSRRDRSPAEADEAGQKREARRDRRRGGGKNGPPNLRRGPRDRGRDGPRKPPEQKLYSLESVVDRGFEDVADDAADSGTRRVHWTIVKRTVADQKSAKGMSAVYILQRDGTDSEFPNLGAARTAANKTIVHPEKLTMSKAEHAAARQADKK